MAPSGLELFAWGVAGAFVSYIVAFALPEAIRLTDENAVFVPQRFLAFVVIALMMLGAGGVVTMGVGAADNQSAFFTGLGWQGIVRAISESASHSLTLAAAKARGCVRYARESRPPRFRRRDSNFFRQLGYLAHRAVPR